MSKEAMKWASAQNFADQTLRSVIKAVAFLADRGTVECRSSQADIAREIGVTDRTVRGALTLLDRLGAISRRARSNGFSGRSTDAITLSVDKTFDLTKADIVAARHLLQLENSSGCKSSSNRKLLPLQPEAPSGDSNTVNTVYPFHGRDSSLYLQEGTYTCEAAIPPAEGIDDWLPDAPPSNVVPFKRGAV